MIKTGWHYTSERNWDSIKKYGMRCNPILKDELLSYFDVYPKGIWVWENELEKQSELGSILWQLSSKGCTTIVKLAITYDTDYLLRYTNNFGTRLVRLFHSGMIGDWQYHKSEPEALIITEPVKSENIELVRTYDLMDIVND